MLQKRNKYLVRVAQLTGICGDDIMSNNRSEQVSTARHLVMWALITFCHYSTTEVGILMRRSNSAVIYGTNCVNGIGKPKGRDIDEIIKALKGGVER